MPILIFCTLFLAVPALASSQGFGGIGTRAEGMGGAFVAVADDASAAYWNPAGVATGATLDFQVSGGLTPVPVGGSDLDGTNFFMGLALPVLGMSFYRTHTVQGPPDRENGGSGRVPIRLLTTSNVGVTVVQTVVPNVVIGTTARIVWGGIEGFPSRTTGDFDAGAMVSAGNLRVGSTGRNLREPEFEIDEGTVEMKRHVRFGAALAPRSVPEGVHGPFSLAFDMDLTETPSSVGDTRRAAVGGEYWFAAGRVGVRAGVRWSTADTSLRSTSGGLTVRLPKSVHVEGQITKPNGNGDSEWLVGARITF
jgi:F plasmid transfer operon, TraF, protein